MKDKAQAAVLFMIGNLLIQRAIAHDLALLLHPRFRPLLLASGALLIVLSVAVFRRREGASAEGASWASLFALVGVAALGMFFQPGPLGGAAAARRGLEAPPAVVAAPRAEPPRPVRTEPIRSVHEGALFLHDEEYDPRSITGVPVDVVGFVHKNTEYGRRYFTVTRFLMVCCAADASPVGLLVGYGETPGLQEDSWVRVQGRFVQDTVNYAYTLVVAPDVVEAAQQPADPYLYPPGR